VVAQRLLNRMVNNQARHFEVSSRLAISKHLGMPQFESSHTYAYIFTWGAVYNIQKQQKVTFTEAAESQNGLSLEQIEEQIDIDLGYQLDIEFGFGDLIQDPHDASGKPMVVSQDIDYKYRPHDLEDLNFMEFNCILQKYKVSSVSSLNASSVIKDNDSDHEVPVYHDHASDAFNSDSETSNLLHPVVKKIRSRGRSKNGIYQFMHLHPQSQSHQLRIKSRPSIPFLAGEHVPEFPRKALEVTVASLSASGALPEITAVDKEKLNRFGAYYLVLLCPWSMTSYAPRFELSNDGFGQFI